MSAAIKFNREDVSEKAKNLYWEKGYHATSMRNLQDVINMHPGSIYAAFGSKDKLFILNCGVSCEKYCHNKVLNKDYSVQLSAATNLSHEQVSGACYA